MKNVRFQQGAGQRDWVDDDKMQNKTGIITESAGIRKIVNPINRNLFEKGK